MPNVISTFLPSLSLVLNNHACGWSRETTVNVAKDGSQLAYSMKWKPKLLANYLLVCIYASLAKNN